MRVNNRFECILVRLLEDEAMKQVVIGFRLLVCSLAVTSMNPDIELPRQEPCLALFFSGSLIGNLIVLPA